LTSVLLMVLKTLRERPTQMIDEHCLEIAIVHERILAECEVRRILDGSKIAIKSRRDY
jgi:hypothetical protein